MGELPNELTAGSMALVPRRRPRSVARTARVRLTKRLIDATPFPKDGERLLRDSELPGLCLRVTKGAKAFIILKRVRRRLWKLTVGAYGPLTVEQARDEARVLLARIVRGEDPLEDRRTLTFGEFADIYLERHARPRKRSVRDDIGMLKADLACWKTRPLASVTTADVAQLHNRIGRAHPYRANRVLSLVKRMFNLARRWKLHAGENPAVGVERFPEVARDRFVQPNELPRLLQAIHDEPNPYVQVFFLAVLLTGARRGEALAMRWEDVDLENGVWRIPTTKANRAHRVPLARPLVDLLTMLPRQHGSPFVFPGRNGQSCRGSVKRAWNRIRRRAKLEDVRLHDLRRTLGSWLAASGASLPLIGRALNHSQPSTTAVYARLNLDPVREALEANARRMLAVDAPAVPH